MSNKFQPKTIRSNSDPNPTYGSPSIIHSILAKMSCYQSDSRKGSRLTPLHQAVLEDSPRHLTLLLKLGADPQLEGVCGESCQKSWYQN